MRIYVDLSITIGCLLHRWDAKCKSMKSQIKGEPGISIWLTEGIYLRHKSIIERTTVTSKQRAANN